MIIPGGGGCVTGISCLRGASGGAAGGLSPLSGPTDSRVAIHCLARAAQSTENDNSRIHSKASKRVKVNHMRINVNLQEYMNLKRYPG